MKLIRALYFVFSLALICILSLNLSHEEASVDCIKKGNYVYTEDSYLNINIDVYEKTIEFINIHEWSNWINEYTEINSNTITTANPDNELWILRFYDNYIDVMEISLENEVHISQYIRKSDYLVHYEWNID